MYNPRPKNKTNRQSIQKYPKSYSQQLFLSPNEKAEQYPAIPFPNQQGLYKQLIKQMGLHSSLQKKKLKMSISNHYRKHLSKVAVHQQKAMRFLDANQQTLQNIQTQRKVKNANIALKQQKALVNKKHQMLARSKMVEESLIRWRQKVNQNKKQQKQMIINSARTLQKIQDKCQESSLRKSQMLIEVSSRMRQQTRQVTRKTNERKKTPSLLASKSKSSRKKQSESPYEDAFGSVNDPEKSTTNSRKNKSTHKTETRYRKPSPSDSQTLGTIQKSGQRLSLSKLKTSTQQQVIGRQRRLKEEQLERGLYGQQEKNRKIKEARQVKKYLQVQKAKQTHQWQKQRRRVHKKHREQQRHRIVVRNEGLNRKHNQNRTQMRDISLPLIHGYKSFEQQLESNIRRSPCQGQSNQSRHRGQYKNGYENCYKNCYENSYENCYENCYEPRVLSKSKLKEMSTVVSKYLAKKQ